MVFGPSFHFRFHFSMCHIIATTTADFKPHTQAFTLTNHTKAIAVYYTGTLVLMLLLLLLCVEAGRCGCGVFVFRLSFLFHGSYHTFVN